MSVCRFIIYKFIRFRFWFIGYFGDLVICGFEIIKEYLVFGRIIRYFDFSGSIF